MCCFTQYRKYFFLSSHLREPYFVILSSSFCVQLSIHGELIPTTMTFFSFWSMNLASSLFCGRCSCSANTGTSYKDFGPTRRYHGGTESASPKSLSISKNSTWRVALHLKLVRRELLCHGQGLARSLLPSAVVRRNSTANKLSLAFNIFFSLTTVLSEAFASSSSSKEHLRSKDSFTYPWSK